MGLQDLDPDALLSRMSELGVLLRAEGDTLCYDVPSAVTTPELLAALHRHRASLLSRVKAGAVRRAPATPLQRSFIAAQLEGSGPQVYNIALRITFGGPLNVTALREALSALVARHEILRTRYVQADDQWWQEVLPARPVDLGVQDLTTLPVDARDAEIERITARLAGTKIDLLAGTGPVLRLLRAADQRWVLLFVMHHVSCDGWGLSVLLQDFAALYTAAVSGRPDGLERPMQPIEFALWQQENQAADKGKLAYWSRQLGGAPCGIGLPTDRPRPAALSGQGDIVFFSVPADLRSQVQTFARRRRKTPFAVTAAAFGVLLSRLSGQQDIVIGVMYANRERYAHESLVACIALNFGLRIRVDRAGSFADLVDAVSRDTIGAISNMVPRAQIPASSEYGDVPDRLTVAFQYEDALDAGAEFPGLTVAIEDLPGHVARAELCAGLIPAGDVLTGYVEYSTDLWDRETIEQWADAYRELLREVAGGRAGTGRPSPGAGVADADVSNQMPSDSA
jgi:Condensation domain/TubC N-terminal docking domain